MSLVSDLQEMRRCFGICPCCGEVFRLSDATMRVRGRAPQTVFDKLEARRQRHERNEEKFDASLEESRRAAAREGRADAQKRLREIGASFTVLGVDPHDVKVLFDPVRYVVFDGLAQGAPRRVVLVGDRRSESVAASILRAISAGNLEWWTLRIDADGRVSAEHPSRRRSVRRE